jgi:hypothetical protein
MHVWVVEFSTDAGYSWKALEAYPIRQVARQQLLAKGHWSWARIRPNRRVRIRKYTPQEK